MTASTPAVEPLVIGLDLSSTATGVCLPGGDTFTIAPSGDLHERCRVITAVLRQTVPLWSDRIVIESIGTNRVNSAIAAASIHARVIDQLWDWRDRITWVSPSQVKKFAMGKGAGKGTDKVNMALAAQRNGWAVASIDADDNQADAWWLWAIGRGVVGAPVVDQTAYRQEVLGKL